MEILQFAVLAIILFVAVRFLFYLIVGAVVPLHISTEKSIYKFIKNYSDGTVLVQQNAIREIANSIAEMATILAEECRSGKGKYQYAWEQADLAARNIVIYKTGKGDYLHIGKGEPEAVEILRKFENVDVHVATPAHRIELENPIRFSGMKSDK